MQLVSNYNKGNHFSLCLNDIFSKYACIAPLKNKKGIPIGNIFQRVLDKSIRKPNRTWTDKSNKFQNETMRSWLQDFGIIMYSTHNENM